MEIRNNSVSGGGAERIDLTRTNRDAIRKTTVPEPKAPGLPLKYQTDETRKRIHNHREGMEKLQHRIEGARGRVEANQAFHQRVKHAREVVAARGTADSLEVSSQAQELVETTLTPRPSEVDGATRAKRVSDLKSQYESGKLDVENLVAEAAYRMLGGE